MPNSDIPMATVSVPKIRLPNSGTTFIPTYHSIGGKVVIATTASSMAVQSAPTAVYKIGKFPR